MKHSPSLTPRRLAIYTLTGIACLAAGAASVYWGSDTSTRSLESESINADTVNPTVEVPENAESLALRIAILEQDILQETHDPERAIELRKILQELRNKLATLENQST